MKRNQSTPKEKEMQLTQLSSKQGTYVIWIYRDMDASEQLYQRFKTPIECRKKRINFRD